MESPPLKKQKLVFENEEHHQNDQLQHQQQERSDENTLKSRYRNLENLYALCDSRFIYNVVHSGFEKTNKENDIQGVTIYGNGDVEHVMYEEHYENCKIIRIEIMEYYHSILTEEEYRIVIENHNYDKQQNNEKSESIYSKIKRVHQITDETKKVSLINSKISHTFEINNMESLLIMSPFFVLPTITKFDKTKSWGPFRGDEDYQGLTLQDVFKNNPETMEGSDVLNYYLEEKRFYYTALDGEMKCSIRKPFLAVRYPIEKTKIKFIYTYNTKLQNDISNYKRIKENIPELSEQWFDLFIKHQNKEWDSFNQILILLSGDSFPDNLEEPKKKILIGKIEPVEEFLTIGNSAFMK